MPIGRCLAAVAVAFSFAATARGADVPFPVDPEVLAAARASRSIPCAGESSADFVPDPGAPSLWRVGGAVVAVRRRKDDRLAFVLDPPAAGELECSVRDVIVLPRRGTLLACALQDGRVAGLGVHTLLPDGRRDLLFWKGDGRGGLEQPGADGRAYESDTGELICALPDPIP